MSSNTLYVAGIVCTLNLPISFAKRSKGQGNQILILENEIAYVEVPDLCRSRTITEEVCGGSSSSREITKPRTRKSYSFQGHFG